MRLICVFLCYLNYIVRAEAIGDGYHKAIGIPMANKLMSIEGISRIVGGRPVATITAFPHQAGIIVTLRTKGTSVCGGAVISNTRILSAAHCWWDGQNQATQYTIVLGSLLLFSGGTRIVTKDVITHPNWNVNDIRNDIAIIKTTRINFNSNIQAIALPDQIDANQHFSGLTATASGYGKTSDAQTSFPTTTTLHHVNMEVLTNAVCQRSFDFSIHPSQMCTIGVRGIGTCDGDSGGPLTVVWKNQRTLVGIVSFGVGDGCQSGFPSVYTRVTAFLPWIRSNM